MVLIIRSVITSYSIHYTKLYEGFKVTFFDEGNGKIPTNFSNVAVMTEEEFQPLTKKYKLDALVIRYEGRCFLKTDNLPKKVKKAVHPFELGEPSDFRIDAENYRNNFV